MHRTSSSLLSACCKCSVTGTEIVTGNLSLLTPAHAVLYLSTHASSVLYYMPSYLAPPLRAHQGQTAGAERNIALRQECCRDGSVGGDVCHMVSDYVRGQEFVLNHFFLLSLYLFVKYKCHGVFKLLFCCCSYMHLKEYSSSFNMICGIMLICTK